MAKKEKGPIPKIGPKTQFFKILVPGSDNRVPIGNSRFLQTRLP